MKEKASVRLEIAHKDAHHCGSSNTQMSRERNTVRTLAKGTLGQVIHVISLHSSPLPP
jgi:hypothetical protein